MPLPLFSNFIIPTVVHLLWDKTVKKTRECKIQQLCLRGFVNRKTFHLHDELDCLYLHIPENTNWNMASLVLVKDLTPAD